MERLEREPGPPRRPAERPLVALMVWLTPAAGIVAALVALVAPIDALRETAGSVREPPAPVRFILDHYTTLGAIAIAAGVLSLFALRMARGRGARVAISIAAGLILYAFALGPIIILWGLMAALLEQS